MVSETYVKPTENFVPPSSNITLYSFDRLGARPYGHGVALLGQIDTRCGSYRDWRHKRADYGRSGFELRLESSKPVQVFGRERFAIGSPQ
jgi:hypothetical protein